MGVKRENKERGNKKNFLTQKEKKHDFFLFFTKKKFLKDKEG